MLDFVARERRHEPIPRDVANSVVGMWVDLSLEVYREDFEQARLRLRLRSSVT